MAGHGEAGERGEHIENDDHGPHGVEAFTECGIVSLKTAETVDAASAASPRGESWRGQATPCALVAVIPQCKMWRLQHTRIAS